MDFLDPKKKRRHRNLLIIGYFLIAIMIMLFGVILYYYAYGFNFDTKTRQVVQNGLLFVNSQPSGADIKINGEVHKNQTDARISLPGGQYRLELTRANYRPWSKIINLEGGTVERVAYPLLIPTEITRTQIRDLTTMGQLATQSPDKRWLVLQQSDISKFDVFDLGNDNLALSTITLPASVFSPYKSHSFKVVEWSSDNRRLLIEHSGDGQVEFIVIDREAPNQSFNLNKFFNLNPSKITLKDKAYNQYYFYYQSNGLLQDARIDGKVVNTLATGVKSYKTHGQDIVFIVQGNGTALKAAIIQGGKTYILRELPVSDTAVDVAQYSGNWYYAVTSAAQKKTYIYKNPVSLLARGGSSHPAPVEILKVDKPSNLSFSQNARFIALQGGQMFAVYDLEYGREYNFSLKEDVGDKKVEWMDGHRFALVLNGKITIFEYDGENLQQLFDAHDTSSVFFSGDYKFVLSISPSNNDKNKPALMRGALQL